VSVRAVVAAICAGVLTSCTKPVAPTADLQEEGQLVPVTSGETIYVRRAGHGSASVVLLPGNNCSGEAFAALLALVEEDSDVAEEYSFFAFDYRGSGRSSYSHPIQSLDDFARDFADVVATDPVLREGRITLVGHSMGFGVAQCMVALDPSRYTGVISLAGIGTRGVRVIFVGSTVGADPVSGKTYSQGDWADSQEAVAFHQRSWMGENRTIETVASMWNTVVYNDILKLDPSRLVAGDPTYLGDPGYRDSIADVMTTVYMPESLYASHRHNATSTTLEHVNKDGTEVALPGTDRLDGFDGLDVLLVKAKTDRIHWRGDLVIDDSITRNTKYDLRCAGARVTAIMIEPDIGYDHGFPIHHPMETLELICAFAKSPSNVDAETIESIFGEDGAIVYPSNETDWELEWYGAF
jgi:pimeloyl-ACP methyl ester carboxylesterase